jgi:hypothetical protein
MKKAIIIIVIVMIAIAGTIAYLVLKPEPTPTENGSEINLNLIKTINLQDAARPEMIATNNRVFVVYHDLADNTYSVKIFDKEIETEITSKVLVSRSLEYGTPTDIRVSSDDNYLYTFYETVKGRTNETYLRGAKYSLNDNFKKVASTGLITSGKTHDASEYGDEKLDDPIPLVGKDSIYTITRYKQPFDKFGETKYKVYEFTKDMSKIREFDLDLSSVADGGARQASAIYHQGYYYMALATTVGPATGIALKTPSDILIVKLDTDWKIKESKIISTDNADPNDTETYVTGFQADENNFYLTYNQVNIPKIDTEFRSPLKIYDKEFNLLLEEIVKVKSENEAGLRPSLEVTEDRIFIGHSLFSTVRELKWDKDSQIFIYEVIK